MIGEYSKHVKRLIRELVSVAYEREFNRELSKLDASFAEWRSGQISGSELNERIHKYHNGASRKVWSFYCNGEPDIVIAYAIVTGVLKRDEIPGEVLDAIERPLAFYQDHAERDEVILSEE